MAAVAQPTRPSFAEAVDDLTEARRELLREAQYWLGEWEQHRDDIARGRLLQTLDTLAVLTGRAAR